MLKRGETVRAAVRRACAFSHGYCFSSEAQVFKGRSLTGLYGYDVLKSPSGFQTFAEEAIQKSDDLVECIKRTPPSMQTLGLFDELSDTICTVVDSAELCRNTHSDVEFVEEASRASMKIYEYLHRLNTNSDLYSAIVKVEQSDVLTTEEAKRAAYTHRVEFERGGVQLPHEKLGRVQQLNLQITHLGREFVGNILKDPGHVDLFSTSKVPKCIRQMTKPIIRSQDGTIKVISNGESCGGLERGTRVILESDNLNSLLKWAKDSELLGYRSFAEFNLAPTMAGSSDVVNSFLLELSEKLRGRADEELKMMETFGHDLEGPSFKGVNAWDEPYYTGLMKARAFGLNSKVLASYFPLNQCIEGLKLITQSLFGATFKQVHPTRGESWHPEVYKFNLHHSTEGVLGHLYLDLYSRPGKFPASAHFTLKGGRRLAEDRYQLPVVVIVCNFSRPSSIPCPVLNHWELETLFHEFGHALHSLLTRTDYQHFSGTRTVLDFVEIPSNLFENYAWDYRVLSKFAKHYATGETIPRELVEAMNKSKNMFAATELQRQVLYSMMDQCFFGEQPLPAESTSSVFASLIHKHTSWKHVEGTHWHARFIHLCTYGAGYYSYLYARCIAATIWNTICEADPLSPEAGEVLRKHLLQHGGAKDPALIIKDCTNEKSLISYSKGVKPSVNWLFKELEF